MTWVRIDDHFDEHPKFARAGPLGIALWTAALAYANRNLTDGFVPWSVAERLLNWQYLGAAEADGRRKVHTIATTCGFSGDDVTGGQVAALLVDAGLWEEADGGYVIHDYGLYQPSKAEVLAERAKHAARQAAYVARKRRRDGVTDGVNDASLTGAPYPVPDPVPDPVVTSDPEAAKDAGRLAAGRARAREAAAPARVPARWDAFDALLRDLPAYHPTAAFYGKLDKYQALDLEEEAIKMAAWVTAQPHRECSVAFVLNWLQKAQAELTRATTSAAPRRPRRAPAPAAPPASGGWPSSPPEVIDAWLARGERAPAESGPSQ